MNKMVKTMLIYFVGNILSKLIYFILLPLYTTYISPADYGMFDIISANMQIITSLVSLEFWNAILRYMIEQRDKKEEQKKVVSNGVIISSISLIVYTIGFLIYYFVFGMNYAILIFLYGIFTIILQIFQYIARGAGENTIYAISGCIGTLVGLIANIYLVLVLRLGLSALLISYCIQTFVQILIIAVKVRLKDSFKIKYLEKELCREMLRYSLPLVINSIAFWFINSYNRIIIYNSIGADEAGLYSVANKFAIVISLIASIFAMAWQETAFTTIESKNRKEEWSNVFDYYVRALMAICICAILGLKIIYPYYIGEAYRDSEAVIPMLFLANVVSAVSGFYGHIYGAEKRTNIIFYSTIVGGVTSLVCLHVLIKFIGIQAAPVSLFLSFMATVTMRQVLLDEKSKIIIDKKYILVASTAFFITIVSFYNFDITSNCAILLIMIVFSLVTNRNLLKGIINFINDKIFNGGNIKMFIRKFVANIYYLLFSIFKMYPRNNKKVVFISYYGEKFSCNPAAIFNKLKNKKDFQLVVVTNKEKIDGAINVKYKSIRFIWHMATANTWISNVQLPHKYKPKKGTKYIQTWHAAGAFKKFGLDIDSGNYDKCDWSLDAQNWTKLITSCKEIVPIYAKAFGIVDNKDKIVPTGLPRNDILADDKMSEKAQKSIRKFYNVPEGKKIALYAPTFRDNKDGFELNLDLYRLKERFKEEWFLLIRLHPNIKSNMKINDEDFYADASNYDEMQNLLCASDLLITDYSSSIFDYSALGKPIVMYSYDLEEYTEKCRGFYYDYKDFVPGPIAYNQEQLEQYLLNYNKLKLEYSDKIEHFSRRFNENLGNATDKVIDIILEK